jgi:hypothetical protein
MKGNVILKGPPWCLSGPKIVDMLNELVLNENEDGFVGFGTEHNWTHVCGLWELPYIKSLILMHNIDVMHQERNVVKNIISTCMNFAEKTKDNLKARRDLSEIYNRPTLELMDNGGNPCAPFCLKLRENKQVMRWLKILKFSNSYAMGIRRAVNLKAEKLNRLKSHDYHLMMERLLPIMFRGYLKEDAWKALAEVSYF